jgi:hypothetical protein
MFLWACFSNGYSDATPMSSPEYFLVSLVCYPSVRISIGSSFPFASHRIETKGSRIMSANLHWQVKLCIIISLNRPLRKCWNIMLIWFHILFFVPWDLAFSVPDISFPFNANKRYGTTSNAILSWNFDYLKIKRMHSSSLRTGREGSRYNCKSMII